MMSRAGIFPDPTSDQGVCWEKPEFFLVAALTEESTLDKCQVEDKITQMVAIATNTLDDAVERAAQFESNELRRT